MAFFRWMKGRRDARAQIEQLRESVELPPEALAIESLLPVICPGSFLEAGDWPGPIDRFSTNELCLTWAYMQPHQTMVYLNRQHVEYLHSRGIDFRRRAIENLRASTDPAWSHERRSGEGMQFVALMHADGLGPSRVLLTDELAAVFPEGYRIAVPERSCGIVFSAKLSGPPLQEVEALIARCFQNGTRPMTSSVFGPADFESQGPANPP